MPRGQHAFNLPRGEIILTGIVRIIHVIVDRVGTVILGGNNTILLVVVATSLEITIIASGGSTVTCIHIGRGASDCRISLWIGIVDKVARFLATTLCIFGTEERSLLAPTKQARSAQKKTNQRKTTKPTSKV